MDILLTSRNDDKLRNLEVQEVQKDEDGNITSLKVRITEASGNVVSEGSALTEEVFNCINWTDENHIKVTITDEGFPQALSSSTQITVDTEGVLWVIPPVGKGESYRLGYIDNVSVGNGLTFNDKILSINLATEENAGTVKVSNNNGLTINDGIISMTRGSNSNFGSVKVENGNGLTIESGVVSMETATQENPGSVIVTNGNGLQCTNGTITMNKATSTEVGSVKVADANGLTINDGNVSMTKGSTSNFGTVKVTNGNGLKISSGVISLDKATSSSIGAVKVTTGNGLNISSGTVSMNLATSTSPGTISSSFYNKINKSFGTLIYASNLNLNYNTMLDCVSRLCDQYNTLKFVVYKDLTTYGDENEYVFSNHKTYFVQLFYDNVDSYSNTFSFITGVSSTKRYWIEGSVQGRYIYLQAFNANWNSTTATRDSELYHVEVYGY